MPNRTDRETRELLRDTIVRVSDLALKAGKKYPEIFEKCDRRQEISSKHLPSIITFGVGIELDFTHFDLMIDLFRNPGVEQLIQFSVLSSLDHDIVAFADRFGEAIAEAGHEKVSLLESGDMQGIEFLTN